MKKYLEDSQGNMLRLSIERWVHIIDRHPEMEKLIEYIEDTLLYPDFLIELDNKEMHAIKRFEKSPLSKNKFCVVIYSDDGFIITSYFVRRLKKKYLL
ncbi:MAG: hypothetical protein IPL53_00435 [Ignavibacteria bacterium]|nr:hypothetical protein [Ignavibacteria bacterium]